MNDNAPVYYSNEEASAWSNGRVTGLQEAINLCKSLYKDTNVALIGEAFANEIEKLIDQ